MIMDAKYQKDIRESYSTLDAQTEMGLIVLAQQGNLDARNKIVNSQLRQIVNIAKAYANSYTSIEDLIAYGTLGIDRSIKKFDTNSGVRFMTYAIHWVRAEMQSYALTNYTVQMPMNVVKEGIEAGLNTDKVKYDKKGNPIDKDKVKEKLNWSVSYSMDAPIREGKETTYADTFASDAETDAETETQDLIGKAMMHLTSQDQQIIDMFFGISEEKQTLEEIGERFNLTKQAISVRVKKSLELMRKKMK